MKRSLTLSIVWTLTLLAAGCGGASGGGRAISGAAAATSATRTERAPVFHQVASLPGGASAAGGGSLAHEALITGGASPSAGATTRVAEVDLGSGQSRPRARGLNEARTGHAMITTDHGYLVFGGVDADGQPVNSFETLAFDQDRWDVVAGMQVRPAIEGVIYAERIGDTIFATREGASAIDLFTVTETTLTQLGRIALPLPVGTNPQLAPLATERGWIVLLSEGGFNAVIDLVNEDFLPFKDGALPSGSTLRTVDNQGLGLLLFFGGSRGGAPLTQVLALPIEGEEQFLGPVHAPLERPAVAVFEDGTALVAGGTWGGRPVDAVNRVDLINNEVTPLPPLSEPRTRPLVVTKQGGRTIAFIGGQGAAGPSSVIDLYSLDAFRETAAFLEASARRALVESELAKLAQLRRDAALANGAASALAQTLATRQAELKAAEAKEQDVLGKVTIAKGELAIAQQEVATLSARLARVNNELSQLQQASVRNAQRIAKLQSELAGVNRQENAAEAREVREQRRFDALRAECDRVKGEHARLSAEVKGLATQVANKPQPAPAKAPVQPVAPFFSVGTPGGIAPPSLSGAQASTPSASGPALGSNNPASTKSPSPSNASAPTPLTNAAPQPGKPFLVANATAINPNGNPAYFPVANTFPYFGGPNSTVSIVNLRNGSRPR